MSILKKPDVGNNVPNKNDFLPNVKSKMKNYWLQKKASKEQAKEHNAKLDEIAKFITKYITNRKFSKR